MKNSQIEYKVLQIVDRITKGQPLEDSSIELKSSWISPDTAARLIAGHANSARGENIIWILGLNETKGVIGIEHREFSTWFAKVKANFDSISPGVIDLVVPVDGKALLALVFTTDRAPYVTRSLSEKAPKYEVPFREGTSLRTATRADLIRILAPLQKTPKFEILSGHVIYSKGPKGSRFYLEVDLYVTPGLNESLVFPFHLCAASIGNKPAIQLEALEIKPEQRVRNVARPQGVYGGQTPTESDSRTLDSTNSELLVYGPGKCTLQAYQVSNSQPFGSILGVQLHLVAITGADPVELNREFTKTEEQVGELARWSLEK